MAYDDNLYQNPGPSMAGMLGELALFAGIEYGHARTTRALAGVRGEGIGHGPSGWFKDRFRRREASAASREIWKSFTAGKGRGFGKRWHSARQAATMGKYRSYRTLDKYSGLFRSPRGEALAMRMAKKGATGRAIAGLARPVLGVASAYMMWGTMAQMGLEGAAAGVGALRRFGERLRSKVPESSVGWRDMAVREQAFTMRQASLMAVHMSQSGARAALGNEASYLHS
jgi:hypothetical protein